MLPNNDIVYDTYEKMTKSGAKNSTMFIDSSTIDPNVAKKVGHSLKCSQSTLKLRNGIRI